MIDTMLGTMRQVDLPAFYRLYGGAWLGGMQLETLKGEIVREIPAGADITAIEALARAHDTMRHWKMVVRESRADETVGGSIFTEFACEKLEQARGEYQRALSAVEVVS